MHPSSPSRRASRPAAALAVVAVVAALVALAACGSDNKTHYAVAQGRVHRPDGTVFAADSVAVICTVIGRGSFGGEVLADAQGNYRVDLIAPGAVSEDIGFTHGQLPCDFYAPSEVAHSEPDTTVTVKFSETKSGAPVTIVNFESQR